METQNQPELYLTAIIIRDPELNGYTAYFAEFPGVIKNADDLEEIRENLAEAFNIMMEVRAEEYFSHHEESFVTEKYHLALK